MSSFMLLLGISCVFFIGPSDEAEEDPSEAESHREGVQGESSAPRGRLYRQRNHLHGARADGT